MEGGGHRLEISPSPQVTHIFSIEKTVILVFVECYESLKVLILVQQGVAGRGGDLMCGKAKWDEQ